MSTKIFETRTDMNCSEQARQAWANNYVRKGRKLHLNLTLNDKFLDRVFKSLRHSKSEMTQKSSREIKMSQNISDKIGRFVSLHIRLESFSAQ